MCLTAILFVLSSVSGDQELARRATAILETAEAQRLQVSSAALTVRQVLRTHEGEAFLLSKVVFDGDRCRFDVLDGTVYEAIAGELGELPTIKESFVVEGDNMLNRTNIPASCPFTISKRADVFDFHPLVLGLPGRPDTTSEVARCLRKDWKPVQLIEDSPDGCVQVSLVPTRPESNKSQKLTLTFDPGKDWAPIKFMLSSKHASGTVYEIYSTSSLQLLGGHWYPKSVYHLQTRNGEFNWSVQYDVLEASANPVIDAAQFTWEGLGIADGTHVTSKVTGISSFVWKAMKNSKALILQPR